MSTKFSGEVEVNFLESHLQKLSGFRSLYREDYSLVIHGMGSQTRSLYRNLRKNKDLTIIWSGWSSGIWWSYLLSFIPGQAGFVVVNNREKVSDYYLEIGALSFCGLYFIPNSVVQPMAEELKSSKHREIDFSHYLNEEIPYFLLEIDFDFLGGERDGEIFYVLAEHNKCESEIESFFQVLGENTEGAST